MFNNDRYITCGISSKIPAKLQVFLWDLIDERNKTKQKLDYLQVFELSTTRSPAGDLMQMVTHSQEQPRYKKKYIFSSENPVGEKIFVIDDQTHCTMLLANEY